MIIGKSDYSGRSFRFYSSSSFLSCKTCFAFDGDTTNARFPLESFAGHVVHTMPRTAFSCTSKKRKNPCKCFIYKAFRSFCHYVLRCVGDSNSPHIALTFKALFAKRILVHRIGHYQFASYFTSLLDFFLRQKYENFF